MPKKKNPNGMGSVSQRKDGTWTARLCVGKKTNGKPNILTAYTKTEKEAKQALKELRKKTLLEKNLTKEKLTINDISERFLILKKNLIKPRSYDRLETTFKYQISPFIGDMQATQFTIGNGNEFLIELIKHKYSYSTIKKAHGFLKSLYDYMLSLEMITSNPINNVSIPKNITPPKSSIFYFTEEETKKICVAATETTLNGYPIYRLGYLIVLLVNTGLRIGEALALKWSDIDYDNKTLKINKSLTIYKNDKYDKQDETSKKKIVKIQEGVKYSEGRIIPLNKMAMYALKQLYETTGFSQNIFVSKQGKIISPRNADRMFRCVLNKCDLPLKGIHTLRHTCASLLFKKGVDVKTVSEILGHNDVKITYDIYIHLIQEQKAAAVNLIDII